MRIFKVLYLLVSHVFELAQEKRKLLHIEAFVAKAVHSFEQAFHLLLVVFDRRIGIEVHFIQGSQCGAIPRTAALFDCANN